MNDGLQDRQAPESLYNDDGTSRLESGSLPSMPTTSSSMIAAALTQKIIGAPLLAKDAKHLTLAEFATGSHKDKMIRIEGLVKNLANFLFDGNNFTRKWSNTRRR
ncbi:unnamed protein product [Trichogramma brassicae]|uniref:Uncharacterized protein n=1 Tax=Trichogramma brassicae TaxID=86971 RepID=A0A6H5IN32_9HYME|nr:unnamed protein product [Trichogramma brassicae]